MIEINSSKIDKDLFTKEIEKNVKNLSPKQHTKINPRTNQNSIRPVLKEHHFKVYKMMKKINHLLHLVGLSKLASFLKKQLKKTNLLQSQAYLVSDFTQFHDEQFIQTIYRNVLKREVDQPALQHYLHLLRSGLKSKSEILSIIRFSKEGRMHHVKILGIKKRYVIAVLYSIPIVNYFAKTFIMLLTLPRIQQRYNSLEANYHMNNVNVSNEIATKVNLDDFHNEIATKVNLDDFHNENIKINQLLSDNYQQLQREIAFTGKEVSNAKLYLRSVEKSIKSFIEEIETATTENKKLPKEIFVSALTEQKHFLDEFYISFEDKFRGSRADIKSRQAYYLPMIKEVIKESSEVVIDVGCGRGEWLELLQENAISAKGVDLNRAMVAVSQEHKLDVVVEDAIRYLKSLKDESAAAITGFHIVEHLPFEVLIELMDESLRVLKKGGMILFETPNPENILVGSCTFYTDPTHINPIPPVTLEFIAHNRGFKDITLHRLHPIKEPQYIDGMNKDDVNALIYASTKEQDYAVIGYK